MTSTQGYQLGIRHDSEVSSPSVFRTIALAFDLIWKNWKGFLFVVLGFSIVSIVSIFVMGFIVLAHWDGNLEKQTVNLLRTLILVPIGCFAAMIWQRRLAGANHSSYLRYLGLSLLLSSAFWPWSIVPILENRLGSVPALIFVPLILISLVGFFVCVRLSMAFPMIASGLNIRLGDVWARTKGRFWFIFMSIFVATLPASIAFVALDYALNSSGGPSVPYFLLISMGVREAVQIIVPATASMACLMALTNIDDRTPASSGVAA